MTLKVWPQPLTVRGEAQVWAGLGRKTEVWFEVCVYKAHWKSKQRGCVCCWIYKSKVARVGWGWGWGGILRGEVVITDTNLRLLCI